MGMMPKKAYLAKSSATLASRGQAGKGNPLQLDCPISTLRSLPNKVSVEFDPLSPGAMVFLVITPSISTLDTPFTVATRMQRINKSGNPPVSRNISCSGEFLSTLKTSWKPLWPTSSILTSTEASDSSTTLGTGTAIIGPIISVSWTLLSNHSPRHTLRRRDRQHSARRGH